MTSRELPELRFPEDGPWTVSVTQCGERFQVQPHKGLLGMGNWALTLNPRRSTGFWRCISGVYLRRQWPKNETALRRAITDCEEWCRRMNEHEAQNKATLQRVVGGGTEKDD